MIIFENIRLAVSSIKANKMRSFLTMLGMIIGISSVISIVSLGDTMRGLIAGEYEEFGTTAAYSYIMSDSDYLTENDLYTYEDLENVKEVFKDSIDYIGTGATASGKVKAGRTLKEASITGMAENPFAYKKLDIVYGKMFSDNDIKNAKPYIVIEDKDAKEIFKTENAVGKTLRMQINEETMEFTVTGVYKNNDSALRKLMGGSNNTRAIVYVPEMSISKKDEWFWGINIVSSKDIEVSEFRNRFINYISRLKGIEAEKVGYFTAEEEMQSIDTIMGTLSLVVGSIAAISLVVGGIGIMNIMLVSVTERTREIGIRKALGARTEDILIQFLVESAIISAAGGVIGTMLGTGIVVAGGMIMDLKTVIKPQVVIMAVVFSAVVGIFFGLYPARKAAKSDPIEALRYE